MIKDILRQIVIQQKEENKITQKTVKREILEEILSWFKDNRIITLTGIRRSGKSTILKQIMQTKQNYCYVNFEDERFISFKAEDFEVLNEVLIEVYNNPKIYFFDEVQNIAKFETFVRRLQDQNKKIVITGSNASLLSKELGTRLTGRYKSFEVYPFSFGEYLAFKDINITKEWFYIAEKKVKLIKLFEDYLNNGGFPEYLKNKDKEYIRTVFENIIYKDIIARYSIKKQRTIKELVGILATNIASQFTYNSLKKSLGLSNSITVKEYISYLSTSYLFFELQRFDFSLKKQLSLPKKIYLVDSALNQLGLNFSKNKGKVFENIILIELKRRGREIYYYKGKNECDFIIKEEIKIKEVIQACYQLTENNKGREINGLLEVMNNFKLKEGLILTKEQEEVLSIGNKTIKVLPIWKWLIKIKDR